MSVSDSAVSPTPVNEELVRLVRQALSHLDAADNLARSDHEDTEESSCWQRQKMELFQAQADFAAALELAPDEPWILFQIGWIQLKLWGLPPREVIETARAIFERVLEIQNDNVCARFALAYLTLVFGPYSFDQEYDEIERTALPFLVWEHEELFGSRQELFASDEAMQEFVAKYNERSAEYVARARKSARNELPGQLLRAAKFNPREAYWSRATIQQTNLSFNYYYSQLETDWAFEQFGVLGWAVPEGQRASYYNVVGLADEGDHFTGQEWFKLAVQWEADDPDDMFWAYNSLAASYVDSRPPDPESFAKCMCKAGEYLRRIDASERSVDALEEYCSHVWGVTEDWKPGEEWPTFIKLCESALEFCVPSMKLSSYTYEEDLPGICEGAAKVLAGLGDFARAEVFLKEALRLNPRRSGASRQLAVIYEDQRRWAEALVERKRIVEADPDPETKRWVSVLTVALDTAQSRQALDTILSEVIQLRAGQELILEEVAFQRDLFQQVADKQRRAVGLLERESDSNDPDCVYADLVDQLHDLVQRGARVQLSAVQAARDNLVDRLGADCFSALLPDSRHFLETAEVFYSASVDVSREVDAALIAVEYAKTVETELRFRFMRGLGTYLDTHSRIAHLLVYENRPHRLKSGGGWGRELTDHSFSLGNIGGLLRTTIHCNENPFVLEYIRRLELPIPWVEHLADDIQTIATRYRNGAAHTKPMERATLQQFRELLFSGGLLQRLVQLNNQVAATSLG